MQIISVQVQNYKSFMDTGVIRLDSGINIVTGKNNAGKSAFLEALEQDISNSPHKSMVPKSVRQITSAVGLCIRASIAEIEECISSVPGDEFLIKVSKSDQAAQSGAMSLIKRGYLDFYINKTSSNDGVLDISSPDTKKNMGFGYVRYKRDISGKLTVDSLSQTPIQGKALIEHIWAVLRMRIFRFKAERLHIGEYEFNDSRILAKDASNLPTVLNYLLSTNPEKFRRYEGIVSRVFPEITAITTRPLPKHQIEILIWSHDRNSEREDLAVPLAQSGTGISQVLAMIYVLISSRESQTLIIDEPNSFLHPGAIRALMGIFQEHSQHQYIISTHSPTIIATSNPSVICLLKKQSNLETSIEHIDRSKSEDLRNCLVELGAGLSEIFGAEFVLWVEGKTEEFCFPLIIKHFSGKNLGSVAIAGVKSTSDFEKKNVRHIFEIYEKLTSGTALVPPAIAYIFDREERNDNDINAVRQITNKKVHFLARRCYENYLLNHNAIQHVLNSTQTFSDRPVDAKNIRQWIESNGSKYSKTGDRTVGSPDWYIQVDAPRLLKDLFAEISDHKESYNKITHSLALTKWMLAHQASDLQEIGDLISRALEQG